MTNPFLFIAVFSIPFLAAILSTPAYRFLGPKRGFLIPFLGAILPFYPLFKLAGKALASGTPVFGTIAWVEAVQLRLEFTFDGFGGLFSFLVAGIGVLIVLYSYYYMANDPGKGRFFSYLLFFLGSMLGVCLSEHLLTMFLFWELTSFSSFLLIGFWSNKEKSRAGALKSLIITSGGALFMLAGMTLLGGQTGAWTWTSLASMSPSFVQKPWAAWALLLMLIGAFSKSAQTPFHIWLPDAMEAPTPVSAFLHSATMVKAGIILIFRLHPLFSTHPLWFPVLTTVGMTTVLVGAILALKHTDLKAILAYTTISQLGLFVVMQGYASVDAILRMGLIFHIFVHAFYKGSLFMLTGIIDHGTGTRDIRLLGRLKHHMPRTAAFMLLAAGSLAGLPPFLGFLSKEGALEASLEMARHVHGAAVFLLPALVAAATVTVAVAAKIAIGVFFVPADEPHHHQHHHVHEASWGFLLAPALLAIGGLIFGAAPSLLTHLLFPLGRIGQPGLPTPHFALWHGFNPTVALSATAVLGGLTLFVFRQTAQRVHERLKLSWNLNTLYDKTWEYQIHLAERLTKAHQNGSLSRYVMVTVGFFAGLTSLTMALKSGLSRVPLLNGPLFSHEVFVSGGVIAGSFLVVFLKNRIGRVLSLGSVGLLVCVYFILRGAPDLALTGFLIEIAMFILVLIIFNQLREEPAGTVHEPVLPKILIAGLSGLTMSGLTYLALTFPLGKSISTYFIHNSAKLAGGLNVVNVIVVDFRGFDTFGETTVLCLAGMGVFALRKIWSKRVELAPPPDKLFKKPLPTSSILRIVSGVAFPLICAFSVYIVFRGHNHPGGGFIGGLITSGGFILELLAVGRTRFLKLLPFHYRNLFHAGLIIALVTGAAPLLFGYPFLTSGVIHSLHFSTASLFDLGVYLAVVGVTTDIIMLVEESERRRAV